MTKQVKKELLDLLNSMLQLLEIASTSIKREDFISQILDGMDIIQAYIEKDTELLAMFYKIEYELKRSMNSSEPLSCDILLQFKESIEKISIKTKIVFFPYKVQMWGVFQTIYETAILDPECEVSVVPIPYYTRKQNGEQEFCYEGNLFPDNINIVHYTSYNVENEKPDIIYVHNIYDDLNTMTEVEKTYFTSNLKQYTRKLVYVPYFVASFCTLTPEEKEFWFDLPTLKNVNKVILAGTFLENVAMKCGIEQEKILSLGSPKLDTIVSTLKETVEIPKEWKDRLGNRKVIFINTLYHVLEHWDIVKSILMLPSENNNLAVIWRPHPLTEVFLEKSMPQYVEMYREVKEVIKQGIDCPYVVLDEEKDYLYSLKRADIMVSGISSLLNSFLFTKKPIIFLGEFPQVSILLKDTFEFLPSNLEDLEEFIVQVLEEQDEYKIQLREQAYRIYTNYDGTSGQKIHQYMMKEIKLEDNRRDVVSIFENGDYKTAFLMWKDIYNESNDEEEKQTIYQLLKDIYYIPNEKELRENYNKNCSLLSNYPFLLGWTNKKWEELEIEVIPLSETEFCVFYKEKDIFSGIYDNATEKIPYFFKNLENPLLLEEIYLQSHLQFLQDNVRKSEDYGGDNHIYLYYENEELLSVLLQYNDLSLYLEDKKFVFLVGEEFKQCYPINFKERFDIEFREEDRKPIQLGEIKRICFWYKHAHSGNDFGRGILGESCNIQALKGHDFHSYSEKNGTLIWLNEIFRRILKEPQYKITFQQLKEFNEGNGYYIALEEYEEFLFWLEQKVERQYVTVIELFKGYFLFQYEKRKINPRIVPMLLWDPHMTENNLYDDIIKSFTYQIILTSMREPIRTLYSSYKKGLLGWNEFQTKFFIASDYQLDLFLNEEFQDNYYGYRFEDLKLYPLEQLKSICQVLNIPVDENMLDAKAPHEKIDGTVVEGFDMGALKGDMSQILSDFDQMRLKIYYEPILKYYGYDTFDLEEYPLTMNEVAQLFHYPFRFERENQEKFGEFAPSPEALRKWIYDVMIQTYNDYRIGKKIRFPKLVQLEWEVE